MLVCTAARSSGRADRVAHATKVEPDETADCCIALLQKGRQRPVERSSMGKQVRTADQLPAMAAFSMAGSRVRI